MKIDIRNNIWVIPFTIINLFLFENMGKIYALSWVNDRIRLVCYALLGILSMVFLVLYLIKYAGKAKRNSVGMTMVIYLLILSFLLVWHSNTASDIWLVCTMIPFSLIMSYYGFSECHEINRVINIQCVIFCLFWILFMYNKLFLYQAGAGKLNSIFYLVLLIPFIMCQQHAGWKMILVGLLSIAVVISLKRTAAVILVIALIVHLWIKDTGDRTRTLKIIIAIIVLAIITVAIQDRLNVDIIGKFEMMSEDGGSGRSDIYKVLFANIFNRGVERFIWGDGYYGVINIIGGTAHNDFLEVLFDFGIIGVIAYINIYVKLVKNYFQMKRKQYPYRSQYLVSIFIFLIMSLLSHVIMIPTYMMFICLFWGMILSHFNNYLVKEGQ